MTAQRFQSHDRPDTCTPRAGVPVGPGLRFR